MSENALLDWLRQRFASHDPSVLVGSGPDDCAHVIAETGRLGMTIDAFAEGSHFSVGTEPRLIAAKVIGASLSDLAASGCRARWILVSACFRRGLGQTWAKEFAEGLAEYAERYGASIVGGDTTSCKQGIFVSVAALGEPLKGGPVLRAGAKPGDALVVTGRLGGSLRGRHLRPEPRFAEMAALLDFPSSVNPELPMVRAAMDISDGLALDLSRLCRESGVGAVIEADTIPVSLDAVEMAKESGRSPLTHALSDGEDFELLAAVEPGAWREFSATQLSLRENNGEPALAEFTRIGWITEETTLSMLGSDGTPKPLAAEGFEHQW